MWMTLIFGGTASVILAMTSATLWHLRWVRRLPALDALAEPKRSESPSAETPIRCSVVLAARDEEVRIEQTIRQLWA